MRQLHCICLQTTHLHATRCLFTGDGYAAVDIISTIFTMAKQAPLPEAQKLQFIREIGL
jgi:hypothetical protein